MATLTYYLSILFAFGLSFGFLFGLKKKLLDKENKILKILSLVLCAIFVVRYFYEHDLLEDIIGASENSPISSKALTILGSLFIWFMRAGMLSLILYPFYKLDWLKNMIKFWGLPIYILSLGFIPQIFTLTSGTNLYNSFNPRLIIYSIEIGLTIGLMLYVFLTQGNFKSNKKDWIYFGVMLIPLLFATMPKFIPQILIGPGSFSEPISGLTLYHRVLIYIGILLPTLLYFSLRNHDATFIKSVLLFISVGTMVSYCRSFDFENLLKPNNWPLHLCNTAMFIIPICLIFKLPKLFYFTLFINVLGAFFAMAMPNYSFESTLSQQVVNFWINHYIAFFMPIVIVALKVYERPKLKQFIYSMVGFGIYFLLVLILNAWFTNYGDCDFFFINSDFIADKLGKWAENLRNVVVSFNIGSLKFTFYPLYQIIFFVVYCALGLGVWFIYEQFFVIADNHYEIRQRKKAIKQDELALQSQLNGRSPEEPMDIENSNKLVIKKLCKRYGNSEVFAVKDADMEVNGGEVFGFLGPNGAGKSTIIKCIVGIQPYTSGSISVCGFDAKKQSVMAKRQIGFVPDHYALYEKLTGREYINYIADLYDVSLEDRNARMEKYVNLFELQGAFDNQMKTYSHGMKQKITIMAALVHNPKIWILDEPLTGLDPNSIFQVKECMKAHAAAGNIVFFSSHIIDVVERICDKITIIKKGKIQCSASIKELEEKGIKLEDFYLNVINGNTNMKNKEKEEEEKKISKAKEKNVKLKRKGKLTNDAS